MKKEIEYNRENTEDVARYITLYVDKLKNIINLMAIDADVKNFLTEGDTDSKKNIKNTINLILDNNKSIKSITLIGKNGNNISNEPNIDMEISTNMMQETRYIDAIKNSDTPVFNPRRKSETMNTVLLVLSISRDIKDSDGENLGVIVFDIKYEALDRYLSSLSSRKQNDSIIVDNNNNIIYYKDMDCFVSKKCLEKFSYVNNKKKVKRLSFTEVDIEHTNWKLISIADTNDLAMLKKSFSHIIIAIFFISLAFTSLVTFLVINRLLNPLMRLENHIKKFESSLSEYTLEEYPSYEIEILIRNFNSMIEKIKYLREYEIKALHSQINPHFLYNTLDTIIWTAEFGNSQKVISITKALANFFRLSLSNGNEIISLRDEIMHIKEYLFIQKQRYENKLSYYFNIEDDLLSLNVPKIIIQPIVENSIYHGIKNIKGTGIINIDIYSENNCLKISVKDNGIGFIQSKKIKKKKTGGVGIKNVDKRIKFYYGKEYGVFVEKKPENKEYTQVILKLPLTQKNNAVSY